MKIDVGHARDRLSRSPRRGKRLAPFSDIESRR
jgi:hypothetical protein